MKAKKIIPWDAWPDDDKVAFIAGINTGSAETLRQYIYAWSYWLAFITIFARERLTWPIALRPSSTLLDQLIAQLALTHGNRGIAAYLSHLNSVATKISGSAAWDGLREQRNLYRRLAKKDPIKVLAITLADLLKAAYEIMNEADIAYSSSAPMSVQITRALEFRDGLMLAFAASFLMRLRNIADRDLPGADVPEAGERWLFRLSIMETKQARNGLFEASDALSRRLHCYHALYRPLIPGSSDHDGLWASRDGTRLSPLQIYKRIYRATFRKFGGEPANLRQIRRIGATAFAGSAKENADLGQRLLTQAGPHMMQAHYNLGGSYEAIRTMQSFMEQFCLKMDQVT